MTMLRRTFLLFSLSSLLLLGPPSVAGFQEEEEDVQRYHQCTAEERHEHPKLCSMLDWAAADPVGMANEMKKWAEQRGLLVRALNPQESGSSSATATNRGRGLGRSAAVGAARHPPLPVVFAHGMGDSCFNDGMQHIVSLTSAFLTNGTATCIPTGKNQHEDTMNGYFLNMDESVEVFAAKIRKDARLKNGFHAIGFSQGNNIIRGYIAKHNDPAVHTFLSVNGVNAGTGAVPDCFPENNIDELGIVGGKMCDLLMEAASRRAYTTFAQKHSFQANYWRDSRPSQWDNYQTYCQLAQWNNEGVSVNETLKKNYAKTQKFVWIMANKDTMVWPKEGEHWGAPDPKDPFESPILPMKDTQWYKEDLFGLKTAEEAGKNVFEAFDGDHLQFSLEDFKGWVTKYLT